MKKLSLKIAVDGFDGTGKTTLIKSMVQKYGKDYSTLVERLIPSSVSLFKGYANNTHNYIQCMSDQFRVSAYLWESYLRLELKKELYENTNLVFFDRWIFPNLTKPIDFKQDEEIISYLIASMPKPSILLLITMSEENIIKHLEEKNDWMLSVYREEELIARIHEFYNAYDILLKKFHINYKILDGNLPIKDIETMIESEINNLIANLTKGDD